MEKEQPHPHPNHRGNVTRFLMVPEAQMRELEAEIEEERTHLQELREQLQARIDASQRMARLYRDLLAGAGDVNLPVASLLAPTPDPQQSVNSSHTPSPPLVVREGARGDRAEGSQQPTVVRAGPGTGKTTTPKYKVNRGGRPTYADVIAWEVPFDEFHISHAWRIIEPMMETEPRDWRRSLRRSLDNPRETRFEKISDKEDWYRRIRGAEPPAEGLFEEGDDDEDQTDETASGVGASETVSEGWRG